MSDVRNRITDFRMVDSEDLKPSPHNFRTHDDSQRSAFRSILAEVGLAGAALARSLPNGDLELIDGHMRREEIGGPVPVLVTDLTDDEARLLISVYDPVGDMARADKERLTALLESIGEVNNGLGTLLEDLAQRHAITRLGDQGDGQEASIDRAEELLAQWGVKSGQVWNIGAHRLWCGDSTDAAGVAKFVGEWRAHSMVTDPPYGVNYGEKNESLNRTIGGRRLESHIQNDHIADYRAFFASFLKAAPLRSKNTAYVFMLGSELHSLRLALDDAGCSWGDNLVWCKNALVPNRKDYNTQHEFVVYGWRGTHRFYGPKNSSTLLHFDRPRANKEHPTMKPIDLIKRLIEDGSPVRGHIYDPFLGSGTAMVAAHMTGRTCYGIETEPKYCAVTLERMQSMGLEPECRTM